MRRGIGDAFSDRLYFAGPASASDEAGGRPEYVVDATIVTIAEEIVRTGFDTEDIVHQRLRRFCAHAKAEGAMVNCLLGAATAVEDAGVVPFVGRVVGRLGHAELFFDLALGESGIDPFDGRPVGNSIGPGTMTELDFEFVIAQVSELVDSLLLPNYLALLEWRDLTGAAPRSRQPEQSAALLYELNERLAPVLGDMPLAWLLLHYAEFGIAPLADSIHRALLRTNAADAVSAARTAAAALTAMSFVSSSARLGDLPVVSRRPRHQPTLVTGNHVMADLVCALSRCDTANGWQADATLLRTADAQTVGWLLVEDRRQRRELRGGRGDLMASAIGLEILLGVEHTSGSSPTTERVPTTTAITADLLRVLRLPWDQIPDAARYSPHHLDGVLRLCCCALEAMVPGIEATADILRRAADRAIPALSARPEPPIYLQGALSLLEAWHRGGAPRTRALLEATQPIAPVVFTTLMLIGAALLEMLAEEFDADVTNVLDALQTRLRARDRLSE
ncbi:hypothetical protein [Nocardia alba]|uniref:hypothetical protein n=1 Tax=Nocardia alba TaxID=225051 RepID=UPI001047144B|nr:hypothetical protein [Nocardia alba]